ncbi:MAG: hypothetical protein MUF34_36385 [Polyangiaceae bacterium]|nr:hypothetical protein [Polyangiaceae bacterium]
MATFDTLRPGAFDATSDEQWRALVARIEAALDAQRAALEGPRAPGGEAGALRGHCGGRGARPGHGGQRGARPLAGHYGRCVSRAPSSARALRSASCCGPSTWWQAPI